MVIYIIHKFFESIRTHAVLLFVVGAVLVQSQASGASWFDNTWPLRRSVDVTWNADAAAGDELCMIELYATGRANPSGDDLRVATAEGKLVASRVLMAGPGDATRVLFNLQKGVRNYFVYFGNKNPGAAAPPIKHIRSGLVYEMRQFTGGPVDNAEQVRRAWERGKPVLGTTMIQQPMYGLNPFGPSENTVSHFSGSIFASVEGEYQFALAADDRATVQVDGKNIIFANIGPADIRHAGKITLTRGWHDLTLYHVNTGGPGWFTLGWRPPGAKQFEGVGRSVGVLVSGQVGPLEERGKTLVADFRAEYQSEADMDGAVSHRIRFVGTLPESLIKNATFEWDFGDDLRATGAKVDHVFLTEGVYPVKLTARVGNNTDTRTTQLHVTREWTRSDDPQTEAPDVHAKVVAGYDVASMTTTGLMRATRLHLTAGRPDDALRSAVALAKKPARVDPNETLRVLRDVSNALREQGRVDDAISIWRAVAPDAPIQRRASVELAELQLWWKPDFASVVKDLTRFEKQDDRTAKIALAHALVLSGRAKDGEALLKSLPEKNAPQKAAALTGAMARSVEYYIEEGDTETGEATWDRWQGEYPESFLNGYSVLLRTRLMEKRRAPQAAAKVAEAFAVSVPGSSYAPQLLDRAAKLLETSDPKKSAELRLMLKQKYPEDPLSQ